MMPTSMCIHICTMTSIRWLCGARATLDPDPALRSKTWQYATSKTFRDANFFDSCGFLPVGYTIYTQGVQSSSNVHRVSYLTVSQKQFYYLSSLGNQLGSVRGRGKTKNREVVIVQRKALAKHWDEQHLNHFRQLHTWYVTCLTYRHMRYWAHGSVDLGPATKMLLQSIQNVETQSGWTRLAFWESFQCCGNSPNSQIWLRLHVRFGCFWAIFEGRLELTIRSGTPMPYRLLSECQVRSVRNLHCVTVLIQFWTLALCTICMCRKWCSKSGTFGSSRFRDGRLWGVPLL